MFHFPQLDFKQSALSIVGAKKMVQIGHKQAEQTEVIKMINYSWCGISQTGDSRVYKCIAILLAQLKELFMRFGTIWGGGGG